MRPRVLLRLLLLAALAPASLAAFADEAPPLPERNPARAKAPEAEKPVLPGEAPTVAWTDDEVAAAKAKCTEILNAAALDYEPLQPIKEGLCGAPAPILVTSIGSDKKVEINPPATITCPMARALQAWLSKIVQPEAKALLGSNVAELQNVSSYACRNRNGGAKGLVSEHAFANALDVSDFILASGERVTVLESWPRALATPPLPKPKPKRPAEAAALVTPAAVKTPVPPNSVDAAKVKSEETPPPPEAPTPPADLPANERSDFRRRIHRAACGTFGTVLGPEANDAHKDHFHFDMKTRRHSSFCE